MILWLVGFSGSGKSTAGKRLSAETGMAWFDTDAIIEEKCGIPIKELFETKGEAAFRSMEKELFTTLSGSGNAVISTGGGFPCHDQLMEQMKASGRVVYLQYPVEILRDRLMAETQNRPLLSSTVDENELLLRISGMMEVREPVYLLADLILYRSADPVREIKEYLEKEGRQSR